MNKRYAVAVAGFLLVCIGILILDVQARLGLAIGTLYFFPLFLSFYLGAARSVLTSACLATLFIVIGWYYSPRGDGVYVVVANRLVSLSVIWVSCFALIKIKDITAVNNEVQIRLKEQVEELKKQRRFFMSILEDARIAASLLKQSEVQLQHVVEEAPNAMVMVDRNRKIVLVNRQAEALFGYKRKELIGKDVEILVPKRYRAKHPGHVQGFFQSARPRSMGEGRDLFGETKDGSEIPIEIGLNPIELPSGLHVLASIIHIAERKRAEQREKELVAAAAEANVLNQRAHELERANAELNKTQNMLIQSEKMAAVGLLAGGVAHEVKNPLAVISQGVQYLQFSAKSENPNVASTLTIIDQAITRADKIVRDLLNFSTKKRLELKVTRVSGLIQAAMDLARKQLDLNNIEVNNESHSAVFKVVVDENKIVQVLLNLIINAMHAMPKGGRLSIRTYLKPLPLDSAQSENRLTVAPGSETGNPTLVCELEDTGQGMTEDQLKQVFDPFFTTKSPGQGVGLGLSICKNIAEAHHGQLTLRSTPGKGTIASLWLPLSLPSNT